jgi:hypothetical protein
MNDLENLPPLPPGASLRPSGMPELPRGATVGKPSVADVRGSVIDPIFGDPTLLERTTEPLTGPAKIAQQAVTGAALMPLQLVTSAARPILGGAQLISKIFEEKPSQTLQDILFADKPKRDLSAVDRLIQEVDVMQENINKVAGPLSYATTRPAEFIGGLVGPAGVGKKIYDVTSRALPNLPRTASAVTGTIGGAGAAGLQPVTPGVYGEEFAKEKGLQTGLGALTGGTLGTFLGAPATSELQRLRQAGVTDLTPGMLSQFMKSAESLGQRFLPFVSGPVVKAERRALDSFNYGAAKTVLDPLKVDIPANLKPGYELNKFVKDTITDRYKSIADQISLPFTPTEKAVIQQQIDQLASGMSKKAAKMFRNEINQTLGNAVTGNNIAGKNFREMESSLGSKAMDYISSKDAVDRTTGSGIFKFQEFMRQQLRDANPDVATELNQIHTAFKNSLPYDRATKYAEAINGVITPGMLRRASKNMTGVDVPIRDFADAAVNVMGKRVVQPEGGPGTRALGTTVGAVPAVGSQIPAAQAFISPEMSLAVPALITALRGAYSGPGVTAANIISRLPGGALGTAAGAPVGALTTFAEDMRRRKEAMGLPTD